MIRNAFRLIAVAAAVAAALAAAAPAAAQDITQTMSRAMPTLKPAVTVTSAIVRIGDLVDNAGPVAGIAIFRAPDYGTTGAVPTRTVLEAIRVHELVIVDTSDITEVQVTRAGRLIGIKDIEERIARNLAGRHGLGSDVKSLIIALDREAQPIALAPSAADLQFVRSSYDPRTSRFDAVYERPDRSRDPLVHFTGSLTEMVEAVTIARSINRGDIIKGVDLVTERRPKSEVGADGLASADQAIGFAARQGLRAGQALKRADLARPELVRRDDTVMIVYQVPGIVLTLRGKALDSGVEGDLVNVMNPQTKRPVQGVVSGPGRVTIAATTSNVALAAAGRPAQ